jgi:NADH dehydrogenase [ubiquinone] 1 alpha subcomplex assembly factor 6
MGQERDLQVAGQYATLEDIEEYGEATMGSLLYLQMETLVATQDGARPIPAIDHLLGHVGKTLTLTLFLRSTLHRATRSKDQAFVLPSQVCAKHGVSAESAIRVLQHRVRTAATKLSVDTNHDGTMDDVDARLSQVAFDVAAVAHGHLETAREHTLMPAVESHLHLALPVLLQAVPCQRWLDRLQRADFHLWHPSLHTRDWKMPLVLWLSQKRSRW